MSLVGDVRVRRAGRGDAPALLAMLVALSRFHGREPTITLEAFERDGWDEPARFDAWIAEAADGTPVGFVQGFPKYASWTGDEWFFVANLWVEPGQRAGGVGAALMAAVEAHARATGRARIELTVARDNPAVGFYERLGLTDRGDYRMALDLAAL